jgi:hypothetical protein
MHPRKKSQVLAFAFSVITAGAHAKNIDFVDILCGEKTNPSVAVRVMGKTESGIQAQIMESDVSDSCYANPLAVHRLIRISDNLYRLELDALTVASIGNNDKSLKTIDLSDEVSTGTYRIWTRISEKSSAVYSANESINGIDFSFLGYSANSSNKIIETKIQFGNHAIGLFPSGFFTGSRDRIRGYHFSSVGNHVGVKTDAVVMDRVSAFSASGQVAIEDNDSMKIISLGQTPGTYDISGLVFGLKSNQILHSQNETFIGPSNAKIQDGTGISFFAGQRHERNVGWSNFVEGVAPVYVTKNSVFRLGANSDGLIFGASYGIPSARANFSLQKRGAQIQFQMPGMTASFLRQLDSTIVSASTSQKFSGITVTPIFVATRNHLTGHFSRYAEVLVMKNFSGINFMAGLRKYSDQKTQFFAGLTIPFSKTIYQVQRNGASTFASASFFDDDLQGRYINSDGKSHLKLTKYFGPIHAGVDLSQSTSSIIFDAAVLRHDGKVSLQKIPYGGKNGYIEITAPEGSKITVDGVFAGVTDSNNSLITNTLCGTRVNISVDDSNSSGVVQGGLSQVVATNCLVGQHVNFDF